MNAINIVHAPDVDGVNGVIFVIFVQGQAVLNSTSFGFLLKIFSSTNASTSGLCKGKVPCMLLMHGAVHNAC